MSTINKLIDLFKKFPTVGPRTAARFVYYLLRLPPSKIEELIEVIKELKNKVKLCQFCFNPFEGEGFYCQICSDPARNKNILCVVEKEADLLSIENTNSYKGLYFILGATVSTLKEEKLSLLRLKEFKSRIEQNNFSEIIIALNPTPEGRTTSLLIESIIKETKKSPSPKITHLAKGIPVGGELEYADPETLTSALEGRK